MKKYVPTMKEENEVQIKINQSLLWSNALKNSITPQLSVKDEICPKLPALTVSEVTAPMFLIHNKLCNLKSDKSSGPDDLPPVFFHGCATALTYPLYLIFNKSLSTGMFPDIWKIANITSFSQFSRKPSSCPSSNPWSTTEMAGELLDQQKANC